MCSPNQKYPVKPEIPMAITDIDDPLNFIPTHLREEEIQPQECPRCGQPMTQHEASSREAIGQEGPYIRKGVHDQCPLLMPARKTKLVHQMDQPKVTWIYDRDNKGPQL